MKVQSSKTAESRVFVAGLAGRYKVDLIDRILSALNEILSHEICMKVTSAGLSIKQLNLAKTILVDIEIPHDFFYKYEITESSGLFAIDAQRITELVNQANSRLTLSLQKTKSERELVCEWKDGSATLPVFEAADEASSPSLDHAIEASLIAKVLKTSLKMIDSDYFQIRAFPPFSELVLVQDDDSATKEKHLRRGSGLLSLTYVGEEKSENKNSQESEDTDEIGISGVYSTKAVRNMLRLWPAESRVTLEFATNRPLALKFRFGKLILAPRVLRE
ncbi:MAG: hypothetical protein GF309_02365 [Candidatus Lokiarchaeota archaeon]|nr:hypothetical protein [Candidatus Lokiarchaeota archaeon]